MNVYTSPVFCFEGNGQGLRSAPKGWAMKFYFIFLVIVAPALFCSASAREASMILLNGKVWTENPAQPLAQAVALDGSKILAVGDNAAIRKLAGPGTAIIDLRGRLLLPGFNDSHVHLLQGGESLITVQLRDASSQAEFQQRLAQFAKLFRTVHGFAMVCGTINAGTHRCANCACLYDGMSLRRTSGKDQRIHLARQASGSGRAFRRPVLDRTCSDRTDQSGPDDLR